LFPLSVKKHLMLPKQNAYILQMQKTQDWYVTFIETKEISLLFLSFIHCLVSLE
jgi:hypothetical protein